MAILQTDKRMYGILVLLGLILCLLTACAAKDVPPYLEPDPSTRQSQVKEELAQRAHFAEGDWALRHKVRLNLPAKNIIQSFDGMMEISLATRTAKIVALAGPGLTLFNMTIRADSFVVHAMLPVFARIPHVAEHIALCVRRIMFDGILILPPASDPEHMQQEQPQGQIYSETLQPSGVTVYYTGTQEGLYTAQTIGREEHWVLRSTPSAEGVWPTKIIFENIKNGYTVTVQFVQSQRIYPQE